MRTPAARPIVRAVAVALCLAVITAVVSPQHAADAGRGFLFVVGGAAALIALQAVARAWPSSGEPLRWRFQRHPAAEPVRELERLENSLMFAVTSRFDLEYRLAPQLREIAADLLAGRKAIELAAEPERARAVLGPELWEVVKSGRAPLDDRGAPGATVPELERLIAALESI